MSRRLLGVAIAAVVTAGLAAGCGSSSSSSAASSSAGAASSSGTAPTTNVTFVADYNPAWPAQVPWNVAMQKGWYKQAGLNINYQLPPSNADPPRLVGAGSADVTVSYTPDLLTAKAAGLDVVALASLLDRNVEGIMTYDPSITTPKSLEGKRVAIYDFPMAQINWKTFTDHYGVDRSKVQMAPEGSYGVPIIVAGKVDAIDGAAGGELDDANTRLKKEAHFWVYQPGNGIPPFYWFVIAANGSWVKAHPAAARAFVNVTLRALRWSEANPKAAADIFAQRNPQAATPALAERSWASILKYADTPWVSGKPLGYMDPAIWNSYAQYLEAQKFLTKPVTVSSLLTNNQYVPGG